MSATSSPETAKRGKAGHYGVLALVIALVVGGIAAAGFYQEEIGSWVRLQGWNMGQYQAATQDFVKLASAGDGSGIAKYVPEKPVYTVHRDSKGQIASFTTIPHRDPETRTLKQLCPSAEAKLSPPQVNSITGEVGVTATFPATQMEFRWKPGPSHPVLTDMRW